MTENRTPYPVRVDAALDAPLSRWLWLVKWLLLIPHVVVLVFLWAAFVVVTVIAFFAILFTGRYPRSLFDFNVGVMRWSWRVHYYGYWALGTDRYPPFSLHEVPDYPAHLDVDYPERLSRGLIFVKWLLAIPHFIVIYVLNIVVSIVLFIAWFAILFVGRMPRGMHGFITGYYRWSYRLFTYLLLLTDAYPPFSLDHIPSPSRTSNRTALPY